MLGGVTDEEEAEITTSGVALLVMTIMMIDPRDKPKDDGMEGDPRDWLDSQPKDDVKREKRQPKYDRKVVRLCFV